MCNDVMMLMMLWCYDVMMLKKKNLFKYGENCLKICINKIFSVLFDYILFYIDFFLFWVDCCR